MLLTVTGAEGPSADRSAGPARAAWATAVRALAQGIETSVAWQRAVLAGATPSRSGGPEPELDHHGPEHAGIELRGRLGTQLRAVFTLHNQDPEPAEVSIVVGPCRHQDGRRTPAPLTVDPARLSVPAGGTAAVALQVTLSRERFGPGEVAQVALEVRGPRPSTVAVRLRIDPDAPEVSRRS